MASVEKALHTSDSGSTTWPTDELLPAELYAEVSSKRQCSSLVAVRALVKSFVIAHNRLVCQNASLHSQQQELDQLQLELGRLILPAEVGSRTSRLLKKG